MRPMTPQQIVNESRQKTEVNLEKDHAEAPLAAAALGSGVGGGIGEIGGGGQAEEAVLGPDGEAEGEGEEAGEEGLRERHGGHGAPGADEGLARDL